MDKWLTKDGLTAIFSDVVKAPVHLSKTLHKVGKKRDLETVGNVMTVGAHLPALLVGFAGGMAAGPVAGFAVYYAYTNFFMGMLAITTGEDAQQGFFPRITEHARKDSNKPQP